MLFNVKISSRMWPTICTILNIEYAPVSLLLNHVMREYFTFSCDVDPLRLVYLFIFAFAKVFLGWEKGGPITKRQVDTGFSSKNVTEATMTWAPLWITLAHLLNPLTSLL